MEKGLYFLIMMLRHLTIYGAGVGDEIDLKNTDLIGKQECAI